MFDMNRFSQAGLTVATAAVSAAVLYAIYPPGVALAVLAVVIAHEMGHYMTARGFTRAAYPVFVPLVFFLVGVTLVQSTDDLMKMIDVYRAGPVWGMLCAAALFVLSLAIANYYLAGCVVSLAFWEIYAVSFGGDSKRIRNARRKLTEEKALLGT